MHSTDDTVPLPEKKVRWKKCPICWDSIYLSETRPVRWFVGQEGEVPKEGGDVVLRLMTRQPGSTLALPRDGAESLPTTDEIPWYFAAEVTDYARVMKGSEDYMLSHFDREILELQLQEKEDELMFGEETIWTKKAVSAIREAKEKIGGIGSPPSAPEKPEERKDKRPPVTLHSSDEEVPDFYIVQHAAKSGQSIGVGVASAYNPPSASNPGDLDTNTKASTNTSSQLDIRANNYLKHPIRPMAGTRTDYHHLGNSSFFFYQALLHYYLSPLDIRILKAAFGDFSIFPATILPRVERVSTGHIVDDELRKRAKYLSHLPYGCEVGFLECSWTDVVAPEILHVFSAEIERRRKKNTEKDVREEKERARAEKTEDDKRWAAARRKRPSVSEDQISNVQTHNSTAISTAGRMSSSADLTGPSSSPPWLSTQARNGSAFASLASPSTSPVAPRTVWGTTAIVPSSPLLSPTSQDIQPADNDGWLQDWERDLLNEDESLLQFRASSVHRVDVVSAGAITPTGKKKKSKKITLMTTNARRQA